MIAFLIKEWKLIVGIVLVVAAVIAFSLLDPFRILSKSGVKNTANLVTSVKEIGELVTAEYYGEVIASLNETKIYDLPQDTLYDAFENCFFDLKYLISEKLTSIQEEDDKLKVKKRKLNNAVNFNDVANDYQTNKIFDHLMVFLAIHYSDGHKKEQFIRANGQLKNNPDKVVKNYLLEEIIALNKLLIKQNDEIDINNFQGFYNNLPEYFSEVSDFHYALNNNKTVKEKKDIVFIGRGWVKAGFRFDRLDKRNLIYNKDRKLVRVHGLSPTILDKDINPWFIPEKKIKGFELVDFYKKATFEEAKKVKKRCKEKLLDQAKKADILNQAEKNGVEALESLFALLLDEPEIRVEFVPMPFDKEYQMISADSLVTVQEALEIDSIYSNFVANIENYSGAEKRFLLENFSLFVEELQKLHFVEDGYKFNLFSMEAASVLDHKLFVTKKDYNHFSQLKNELNENPETGYVARHKIFKEYKTQQYLLDFNATLELIEQELTEVDSLRTDEHHVDLADYNKYQLYDTVYFESKEQTYKSKIYYTIRHKFTVRDSLFDFRNLGFAPPITLTNKNE